LIKRSRFELPEIFFIDINEIEYPFILFPIDVGTPLFEPLNLKRDIQIFPALCLNDEMLVITPLNDEIRVIV
jgi:hypothetical protein